MKRIILITIIALTLSSFAEAGVNANSADLWLKDCMTKSVPNKSNFCWALNDYIGKAIQGGTPTKKGCTSHMASKGFGETTPAKNMCGWYFNDR